jgi:hypothetical protein
VPVFIKGDLAMTTNLSRRAALVAMALGFPVPKSIGAPPQIDLSRYDHATRDLVLRALDAITALAPPLRAEVVSFAGSLPDDEEAAFARLGDLMRQADA